VKEFGKAALSYDEQLSYVSDAFRQNWNSDVQTQIDNDIEKHRKADYSALTAIPEGADVKIEQISHDYIFGAHIFNFNQLGTEERNRRYKSIYGGLFNSATVAFYWKNLEPIEGKPRFKETEQDTEEFWNNCEEPKSQPHWRRPPTDPVIEYCEAQGIRIHGHPIAWNSTPYHTPEYINNRVPEKFLMGKPVKECFATNSDHFKQFSNEELDEGLCDWCKMHNQALVNRVKYLSERYKNRVNSWDICNESAEDFMHGYINTDHVFNHARYGIMPADFTYNSFKLAEEYLPENVLFNINDYYIQQPYVDQTKSLINRGCKIDIVGMQNHLWGEAILRVSEGTHEIYSTPKGNNKRLELLDQIGLPIHVSEITLASPEDSLRGEAIQAVATRNFYRLWFSHKSTMGITWWNTVDDCGAAGEPCTSGIFKRDMRPKLAFHALNELINHEWRTNLTTKAAKDGKIEFRGFKGNYRLSWDENGKINSLEVKVK